MLKHCKRCSAETERNKAGRCKPCARAAISSWYAANREKVLARAREQRQTNIEEYRARERKRARGRKDERRDYMRRYHGMPTPTRPEPETCESCGGFNAKAMHLDHDHRTGAFRGWLCNGCNNGIGYFYDDPLRLRQAAAYLERNKSGI